MGTKTENEAPGPIAPDTKRALIEEAGRRALEFKNQGFHCSESVFMAINATLNIVDPSLVRAVTPFHGGGGTHRTEPDVDLTAALEEVASGRDQRSTEELPFVQVGHLCGALASGVLSIGLVYGRRSPADDLTCADELSFELHRRFREEFGRKECRALRDEYVPLTESKTCEPIYQKGAELAVELILEAHEMFPECERITSCVNPSAGSGLGARYSKIVGWLARWLDGSQDTSHPAI